MNWTKVLQAIRINCKAVDQEGETVLCEGKSASRHIPPRNENLLFNEQNFHVLTLLIPNKPSINKYSRMTTGRSFRQRPLDAHKELPIVRDESLLDSTEGLPTKEHLEHDHKSDSKVPKSEIDDNCSFLYTG